MAKDHKDHKEYFEDHLNYEVWMLGETYTRLLVQVPDKVIANALVESFCIHARILIEFFSKARGANTYTTKKYVVTKRYEKLNRQINNQIAHILDEGRSVHALKKIGPVERQELFELLRDDIEVFKQNLAPLYKGYKALPDLPATVSVSVASHGASSSPKIGPSVVVNFQPGTTTTHSSGEVFSFSTEPTKSS
jgi:hypothetical protein